jgi:hypothetical protein
MWGGRKIDGLNESPQGFVLLFVILALSVCLWGMLSQIRGSASLRGAGTVQEVRMQQEIDVSFTSYDTDFHLRVPQLMLPEADSAIVSRDIDRAYELLNGQPGYHLLIESLEQVADGAGFNRWLLSGLVRDFSRAYIEEELTAELFIFCTLQYLGFDVIFERHDGLSWEESGVYLAAEQQFQGLWIEWGERRYFDLLGTGSGHGDGFFYRGARRHRRDVQPVNVIEGISLVVEHPGRAGRRGVRSLFFDYASEQHQADISYSKPLADYLNTVPPMDYGAHALSIYPLLDDKTRKDLVRALQPWAASGDTVELVNVLLAISQSAFEYRPDVLSWGQDRPIFAEMMLSEYGGSGDCEDKAIFFVALAQAFGLDVAYIDFPGHLLAGVRLDRELAGFQYGDYWVAETTASGSRLGELADRYREMEAQVVPLPG